MWSSVHQIWHPQLDLVIRNGVFKWLILFNCEPYFLSICPASQKDEHHPGCVHPLLLWKAVHQSQTAVWRSPWPEKLWQWQDASLPCRHLTIAVSILTPWWSRWPSGKVRWGNVEQIASSRQYLKGISGCWTSNQHQLLTSEPTSRRHISMHTTFSWLHGSRPSLALAMPSSIATMPARA